MKYSLVIDLKTTKALDLTVPPLPLAQAVRSSNVSLRIEPYGSIPVTRTAAYVKGYQMPAGHLAVPCAPRAGV